VAGQERLPEKIRSLLARHHNHFATLDLEKVGMVVRDVLGSEEGSFPSFEGGITARAERLFAVVMLEEVGCGIPYALLQRVASGVLGRGDAVALQAYSGEIDRSALSVGHLDTALRTLFPKTYQRLFHALLYTCGTRLVRVTDPIPEQYRATLGEPIGSWGNRELAFQLYRTEETGLMRVAGPNRLSLQAFLQEMQPLSHPGYETFMADEMEFLGRYALVRRTSPLSPHCSTDQLALAICPMVQHRYLLSPLSCNLFAFPEGEPSRSLLVRSAKEEPFDFVRLERFIHSRTSSWTEYSEIMEKSGMTETREAVLFQSIAKAASGDNKEALTLLRKRCEGPAMLQAVDELIAQIQERASFSGFVQKPVGSRLPPPKLG